MQGTRPPVCTNRHSTSAATILSVVGFFPNVLCLPTLLAVACTVAKLAQEERRPSIRSQPRKVSCRRGLVTRRMYSCHTSCGADSKYTSSRRKYMFISRPFFMFFT